MEVKSAPPGARRLLHWRLSRPFEYQTSDSTGNRVASISNRDFGSICSICVLPDKLDWRVLPATVFVRCRESRRRQHREARKDLPSLRLQTIEVVDHCQDSCAHEHVGLIPIVVIFRRCPVA